MHRSDEYLTAMNAEPYRSLLENEKGVIEKNGGSDGIRAQLYTNNKFHYSFVLLSNYDGIPFQQTVTDLTAILEGKPCQILRTYNRKAIKVDSGKLKEYVGTYVFAEAIIRY